MTQTHADLGPADVRVLDAVTLLCRTTGAKGADWIAIGTLADPNGTAGGIVSRLDKLVSHGLLVRTPAGGYGPARLLWRSVDQVGV